MRITWNPNNQKDCDALGEVFSALRKQGKPVFAASENWRPGEQLTKFKKSLGRMVVFPRPTTWDRIREGAQA